VKAGKKNIIKHYEAVKTKMNITDRIFLTHHSMT